MISYLGVTYDCMIFHTLQNVTSCDSHQWTRIRLPVSKSEAVTEEPRRKLLQISQSSEWMKARTPKRHAHASTTPHQKKQLLLTEFECIEHYDSPGQTSNMIKYIVLPASKLIVDACVRRYVKSIYTTFTLGNLFRHTGKVPAA